MRMHEWATRFARLVSVCAIPVGLSSCATTAVLESPSSGNDFSFGVMVMAHGGGEEWNAHLVDAVEPLKANYPVEVAFGMADAGSMEAAVRRLESQGVRQVGVVRVFVSGESWYDRTLQILGLQSGAPSWEDRDQTHEGHAMYMPMGFWRVDTELAFHVSVDGLADADEMDEVLTARVRALSSRPGERSCRRNRAWTRRRCGEPALDREDHAADHECPRTTGFAGYPGFHVAGRLAGKAACGGAGDPAVHCTGEFPGVDIDRGAIPCAGIRPLRERAERAGLSGR